MTVRNICVVFFMAFMLTFSGTVLAEDSDNDINAEETSYASDIEDDQNDVNDEDAMEDEQYNAGDENTMKEDQYSADDEDGIMVKYARNSRDRLYAGQKLTVGDSLRSRNGIYRLVMQRDGNLALYNNKGKALWHTRTNNVAIKHCLMQADGNLVLYRYDGRAQWHSRTNGKPNSTLILQNDGNLVIYHDPKPRAIWHTRTAQ